jgi:hypothetical protein
MSLPDKEPKSFGDHPHTGQAERNVCRLLLIITQFQAPPDRSRTKWEKVHLFARKGLGWHGMRRCAKFHELYIPNTLGQLEQRERVAFPWTGPVGEAQSAPAGRPPECRS